MNSKQIVHQNTKTLKVRPNSRSSDFVTPNFVYGCNGGCQSYCYVNRFNANKIYVNDNIEEILNAIDIYTNSLGVKVSNQVDHKYHVGDIGCSTDISFHFKDYNWSRVFEFFTHTPNIKATFATKYVNNQLLKYGNEKLRIRFSLMPQRISNVLEINTSKVLTRINAIDRFIDNGWEVHLNFSPVIFYQGWLKDYKILFDELNTVKNKENIKAEVIFLTHNENLHNSNLKKGLTLQEHVLWQPFLQEVKNSNYGGENVRYKYELKEKLINQFKALHQEMIPWCEIRYIF